MIPEALSHINGLGEIPVAKGTFVYFLVLQGEVVYVGQTKQLFGRMTCHTLHMVTDFDHLFYLPVHPSRLDEVEAHFIKELKPKYNKSPGNIGRDWRWQRTGCTNLVRYTPTGG